jgi:hypothetical protein
MRYRLTTSRVFDYHDSQKEWLESLGFKLHKTSNGWTIDRGELPIVCLFSIEDLEALRKKAGYALIVRAESIEIYDEYRE